MGDQYLIYFTHMSRLRSGLERLTIPTSPDEPRRRLRRDRKEVAEVDRDRDRVRISETPKTTTRLRSSASPERPVAAAAAAAATTPVLNYASKEDRFQLFDLDRLKDDRTTRTHVVTKITCGSLSNEKGEVRRFIGHAETCTEGWARTAITTATTEEILDEEVAALAAKGVHLTARKGICRGAVNEKYIKAQLPKNKIVIVLVEKVPEFRFRTRRSGDTPVIRDITRGFVLARAETDDTGLSYIYIDIICADNGFGNLGMEAIIVMAKNRGYDGVKLAALASVLGYYPKFGFSHRKSCSPTAEKFVISKDISKVNPKLLDDEYAHADLIDYMMMLTLKGFSAKADCQANLDNFRGLHAREKFVADICANDGFYMFRCTNDPIVTDSMQTRGE